MPRRLLLTTALASFLAGGGDLPPSIPARAAGPSGAQVSAPLPDPDHDPIPATSFVELGPYLIGLASQEPPAPGSGWPVALCVDGPWSPACRLSLWIGRKNAWGSSTTLARPAAGLPGSFSALVAVPYPLRQDARLWLDLDHGQGPRLRRSLPLPAALAT